MTKVKKIGIIAEDLTDFEAAKILIQRITNQERLGYKPKIGNGSGKIKSKCLAWSNELHQKGCNLLIVIHDLDSNGLKELKEQLSRCLKASNIKNRYICIPIEELEAWFLSDPEGIKKAFKLKRKPKVKGLPETIRSPKECLRDHVFQCSENEIIYQTLHNALLAKNISLDIAKDRCPSFKEFFEFMSLQRY